MVKQTAVRAGIAKGRALGFWLTFPSTALAKTILNNGKFDWVLIDGEHGLISDKDYYDLNVAVTSAGASSIIRIPCGEEWLIKRALDSGAHGVMTPMCSSVEDAQRIVQYSKYPPVGSRGFGPMFAPVILGHSTEAAYAEAANEQLMVIVQMESKGGVENCEKIAAVEGVDCLFIGPFDLAKQLGVERKGPEHEAAIQRILKAAHSAGKTAAIFCTEGVDAKIRLEQGFDMVSITTDIGTISKGIMQEVAGVEGGKAGERNGY